jgi:hypothetical protein
VHVGAVHHLESIFYFSFGRNLGINLKMGYLLVCRYWLVRLFSDFK